MLTYADFWLIVNGTPDAYFVEAEGPGEIRVPPVPFVFHRTPEFARALAAIEAGDAPTRDDLALVGDALFTALFPRPVFAAFNRAPAALPRGTNLRIKLLIRPPELAVLPWEVLYNADENVFLAARLSYPIVRVIESGTPVASLLAPRPLRVLYVQANPADTAPLNLAASEQALRAALGSESVITAIHETTPAALRDLLREPPGFHMLHYDGHAEFDAHADNGHLSLHDAGGATYPLDGEHLATLLDGTTIRLVVLAACQTGTDAPSRRFAGIAQHLMRSGSLPAVVAMQYAVPDDAAIAFVQGFYGALADDYPVDAATIEGRKAMLDVAGGTFSADWATPVLFMRSLTGDIFRENVQEAGMNEVPGGDQIDARQSQGMINRPRGPVTQNFGAQRTINTSGDYTDGNSDKRQGVFISGGTTYGPVVGSNAGTINATYGTIPTAGRSGATLDEARSRVQQASEQARQSGNADLADDLDGIVRALDAALKAANEGKLERRSAKLREAQESLARVAAGQGWLADLGALLGGLA